MLLATYDNYGVYGYAYISENKQELMAIFKGLPKTDFYSLYLEDKDGHRTNFTQSCRIVDDMVFLHIRSFSYNPKYVIITDAMEQSILISEFKKINKFEELLFINSIDFIISNRFINIGKQTWSRFNVNGAVPDRIKRLFWYLNSLFRKSIYDLTSLFFWYVKRRKD